jgi:probable F420-dependent oxidoreductase
VSGPPPIRVGFGLGVDRLIEGRRDLAAIVDALEAGEFDSFWASDVLGSFAPDPIAALAFAAGRTERLKLGTSVTNAPGQIPTRLAKQLATLDLLCDGRLFPVLGLGSSDDDILGAMSVERSDRGPMVDEMIPLLRRIWSEDEITHAGHHYSFTAYRPHLHPTRRGLSLWLGGRAESELRRAGRLADGWLASFATPAEVACSIPVVLAAAAEAGRVVPADHFGVLMLYSLGTIKDETREFARWRRPDLALADLVPSGADAINAAVSAFVKAGATKFILIPARRPESWDREIAELADVVASLHLGVAA